jgi:3-hydroxyisobutyrate dehydrogenase-like beta-hydroxyacid dehydrogenase
MTAPISALGFVGLGVMGSGQSANLVRKSGLPLTVFDVTPAAVDRLVRDGASAASTVAELARTSQVVFLSLPGAPQVEEVLFGPEGVFATAENGTIVVDLSTSPVELAQRAGEQARARGLHFVDAPVARTRQAAIDGTLSITLGGDEAVIALIEPLLRTMATDLVHCGPNGAGALMKIVNNMVVFETVVALAEALTLVRRSGLVDPATALEALARGSAASFTLENHGRKALLPDVHAENIFPTEYMMKDLGYALDAARNVHVELPAATLAHDLLRRTRDAGYGKNYHTSVVRVIEKLADG